MTTKKTKLEITDDVNFIRFNGRVYSLNDVGKCSLNEVIETSKTFFEQQANQHTEGISDDIAELARQQEREQLEHLRVVQSANVCVIGNNDFNKPVVAFRQGNQGYSQIRFTIWNPHLLYIGPIGVSQMTSVIRDCFRYDYNSAGFPTECYDAPRQQARPEHLFVGTPFEDTWRAMIQDIQGNQVMYHCTVDRFIPVQLLITYFDGSNIKFIPPIAGMGQNHPHCMGGWTLCTGGMNTREYWNNPQYNNMLQAINFESLAARDFSYVDELGEASVWSIYRKLRQMNFINMGREGVTTWRTRQT